MNRTEARKHWARVAAGDHHDDAELQLWLRGVAQAILEADDLPAGVRPGEILRAVGLLGKIDDRAILREKLQVVDGFPFISDQGQKRKPDRGERIRNLIAHSRASGLIEHDVSDLELKKRIERLFTR